MRKSIIAGLTLCAGLALAAQQAPAEEAQAGQAQATEAQAKDANAKDAKAATDKQARAAHRSHEAHRSREGHQAAAPRLAEQPFRIPAHPVVRDCVHVMFPQCARGYDGLNDGTFGR